MRLIVTVLFFFFALLIPMLSEANNIRLEG